MHAYARCCHVERLFRGLRRWLRGELRVCDGAINATLPAGCVAATVHGTTYYQCCITWFQPSFGANGA